MEWIRKKLKSAEPTPETQRPIQKKYAAPQPPGAVLKKRPSHKLTPAPAPPLPNTPQLTLTSSPPGYSPPSNLFSGYKYPENMLNMWEDDDSSAVAPPIPDIREPKQRDLLKDPVTESKRAWAESDRKQK